MRKILIDTDTASDDAVALIAALRDPQIQIEAITVVAGNVPLDLAVKNALISVQVADTYAPPVYRGAVKPMMKALFTSEFVHGDDGMGNMNLPDPVLTAAEGHAIDQIIERVLANSGKLEIITLGPLTNLALAYLKAPEIAHRIKRVVVMGGNGFGPGNVTPVAEFNMFVDAEAAQIVLNSGMPLMFVGWDVSTDETFINQADIDALLASGSEIARFCVRCNATLQAHNAESWGKIGFDLPDPVTVITAIYPEIITDQVNAYSYVEYRSPDTYGQMVIDRYKLLNRPPNVTICQKIDPKRFKQLLFERIC
ncbi:MAG TPA: nucleoside hydrolase [Phototrophicaceae bacterium]|jgi:purine nucleosidase|nr:nucleoside hydrolase [Phototrophicaceae bacterium]